ncbi:MAG: methyltransferase type 12 [Elusimicrobia bacterium]|nr:MAG: methyltransferase type 12 [Elusimicrobiota bacterium]KAF0156728.1 MAG: methyltransferase type 12 [Elusimicrobiota bacterium]
MTKKTDAPRIIKAASFYGELEEASCPVCPVPPGPELVFRRPDGVGIWRCPGCDIMYASPRFTEKHLLRIYESEDFSDLSFYDGWSYDNWKAGGTRSYNVTVLKTRLLKRFLSEGDRVLDVGCATGLFCLEAAKSGFAAEGIDPSKLLIDLGRRALKIDLHHGLLEEFNPGHKFKGLVAWDVLEHVYDPLALARRCAELLEPGGHLFLQVPNHEGISNRFKTLMNRAGLKRSGFKHFGFPQHIYFFNRKSLSALLVRAGFTPLLLESWPSQLKDGRAGPVARLTTAFLKKNCLSDYLTCAARRQD